MPSAVLKQLHAGPAKNHNETRAREQAARVAPVGNAAAAGPDEVQGFPGNPGAQQPKRMNSNVIRPKTSTVTCAQGRNIR